MRARAILAGAVAVLACALALGCGSDDPASESRGTTLTPTQYAEIERLYRAQVPLDGLAESEDADSTRRLLSGTIRSCRQVDRSDPLLDAVVTGCERLVGGVAKLGDLDCATAKECNDLIASLTATMRRLRDDLQRSQPTIEREVSDEACRNALLVPEESEALVEAVDALQRFNDAIQSGESERLEAAGADVDEAFAAFDETPSAKRMLRDLRAACRPAAG